MIYIFDLDGTLSDDSHRQHLIAGGDREAYHAMGAQDPQTVIAQVARDLWSASAYIEIWTGRTDDNRDRTVEWLSRHGIHYHALRMAPAGDHRDTNTIKGEWLAELAPDDGAPWRPVIVFDDRRKCVEWWRRLGVTCLEVADHRY